MTQMLLFDSPTGLASETAVTVASPAVTPPVRKQPASSEPATARDPGYDRGVNHMGDLARLVLMRYDLVARRRARRIEKARRG